LTQLSKNRWTFKIPNQICSLLVTKGFLLKRLDATLESDLEALATICLDLEEIDNQLEKFSNEDIWLGRVFLHFIKDKSSCPVPWSDQLYN
jgi:hypothetical protein